VRDAPAGSLEFYPDDLHYGVDDLGPLPVTELVDHLELQDGTPVELVHESGGLDGVLRVPGQEAAYLIWLRLLLVLWRHGDLLLDIELGHRRDRVQQRDAAPAYAPQAVFPFIPTIFVVVHLFVLETDCVAEDDVRVALDPIDLPEQNGGAHASEEQSHESLNGAKEEHHRALRRLHVPEVRARGRVRHTVTHRGESRPAQSERITETAIGIGAKVLTAGYDALWLGVTG